jgi:two-component system, NarL family, nitrate/nitrite response regulator NarL
VRVVIAEDQAVIRRGLMDVVTEHSGLRLEGTATDVDEALALIADCVPDVALISARLPRQFGQAVLHAMRFRGIDSKVVFITASEHAQSHKALTAGGAGCIATHADEAAICDAILRIADGKCLRADTRGIHAGSCPLSARELQVLELAASSRTGAEIATAMHLSAATVRTYMNRMYEKLGQGNRAGAVAYGIRHGLIL